MLKSFQCTTVPDSIWFCVRMQINMSPTKKLVVIGDVLEAETLQSILRGPPPLIRHAPASPMWGEFRESSIL